MTNIQKLLADVALLCIKHRVDLKLLASDHVMADGIRCSGFFDEASLAIATYKAAVDWQTILVHESCHLDQWIEKSPYWKRSDWGIMKIDNWLKKKKCPQEDLLKAFKDTIKLELDCEKRSVKKIKKYKLDISKPLYIQKANSYLFSYWHCYKYREWYGFPYNQKKIYSKMPTKFLEQEAYLDPETEYLKYYK